MPLDQLTRRTVLRSLPLSGIAMLSPARASSVGAANPPDSPPNLVIAHRGASGYLPEHTLAAKAAAHAMGAHFIEQDVVLSRDDVAVVMHDITLDATTNVAQVFPGRAREDGRHYVIDFTWEELQQLHVHERTGKDGAARYPGRFPLSSDAGLFRLHTLEAEIALVQGMNQSTGRHAGIYPELKAPRWHATHDKDIGAVVSGVLKDAGYDNKVDQLFVQSFDAEALRQFGQHHGLDVPLVQLIGENRWWPDDPNDFDAMQTPAGLEQIAEYATGIGPWYPQLIKQPTLVSEAHSRRLSVHTYTLRADQLPKQVSSFEALLDRLIDLEVDGFFTDFPDRVSRHLERGNC